MDKKEKKKLIDLLKFYKEINSKIILFNCNLNLRVIGKVTKLSISIFKQSLIIDSDIRGPIKMFLEDIDPDSIYPAKLKGEELESPKDRKQIPQSLRIELWKNHFGDRFEGNCFVCKKLMGKDNFEAGHVISVQAGGSDTLENLRTICITCNRSMGTENLNEFKKRYH